MILDNDSFLNYAMKHYDNPSCKTIEDFKEDLNRFIYVKKMFNKGINYANYRLMMNHIIILYNVFERKPCTNMLFFRVPLKNWGELKSFLLYLNVLPDFLEDVGINTVLIEEDKHIKEILKNL
jgi:hypothetical protein